jgi:hypothetical protein
MFLTAFLVMGTAFILPAQSVQQSEIIEEPAQIWPDSSAFIVYDREARPINFADIHRRIGYPQLPADAEIDQSKVYVRILLDQYGNYVRHHVILSGHPVLNEAIEPLIPEIMWLPAEQNGRPVASWITLPFTICFKK